VWREACDVDGKAYWWHSETRETSWTAPSEAEDSAVSTTSNEALEVLFTDYLLTPAAKFDYPSPSTPFLDLVEAHRHAIYERHSPPPFYEHVCRAAEETPAGGPPISRSEGSAELPFEEERKQSASAAAIPMFSDEGMRWNKSVSLTRKQALESIRARLSNPGLRDANPAF
jgi:hypothetical protein